MENRTFPSLVQLLLVTLLSTVGQFLSSSTTTVFSIPHFAYVYGFEVSLLYHLGSDCKVPRMPPMIEDSRGDLVSERQ